MREFKFFKRNDRTDYNGDIAREALEFFDVCINGYLENRYEVTTILATYKLTETIFSNGELSRGTVTAYPVEDTSMRIIFYINAGNVTPFITDHRIERDAALVMAQVYGALRLNRR
jgi:hypothetical protein